MVLRLLRHCFWQQFLLNKVFCAFNMIFFLIFFSIDDIHIGDIDEIKYEERQGHREGDLVDQS
jgi:hypothetical protein